MVRRKYQLLPGNTLDRLLSADRKILDNVRIYFAKFNLELFHFSLIHFPSRRVTRRCSECRAFDIVDRARL